MITSWDIYWITRLDLLNVVCIALLTGSGIVLIIIFINIFGEDLVEALWKEDSLLITRKIIKIGGLVFILSLLSFILIPSTKEAVAIYMVPKIANNEQVQKLPDNAMKFLNGKFKEWINDMEGKKEGK